MNRRHEQKGWVYLEISNICRVVYSSTSTNSSSLHHLLLLSTTNRVAHITLMRKLPLVSPDGSAIASQLLNFSVCCSWFYCSTRKAAKRWQNAVFVRDKTEANCKRDGLKVKLIVLFGSQLGFIARSWYGTAARNVQKALVETDEPVFNDQEKHNLAALCYLLWYTSTSGLFTSFFFEKCSKKKAKLGGK